MTRRLPRRHWVPDIGQEHKRSGRTSPSALASVFVQRAARHEHELGKDRVSRGQGVLPGEERRKSEAWGWILGSLDSGSEKWLPGSAS